VRWIIGILSTVIVLGWIACQIDIQEVFNTDSHVVQTVWRHTAAGWEKVSALSGLKFSPSAVTDVWNSHPHPVIIASLVALLSLMALVAFNPAKRPADLPATPVKLSKIAHSTSEHPTTGQLELRSREWYDQANLS
jgi:hypothetical protein